MNDTLADKLNLTPQPSKIKIRQLEGYTDSIGRVNVTLQIQNVIRQVTIHILKNFHIELLLGLHIGEKFDINVSLKRRQAFIRSSATAQATLITQHNQPLISHQPPHHDSAHSAIHQPPPGISPENATSDQQEGQPLPVTNMGCLFSLPEPVDYQEPINSLVTKFDHLFAEHDIDIGCIDLVEHRIRVRPDQPPIALKPYRASPAKQDEITRQVTDLLSKGIIRESESPWAAPVTLAPKGDGGERMCPDVRKLNLVTVDDKFPLPRIQDITDRLKGARFMTKLDIKWAYYHIKMAEEDIEKTAFVTSDGHYEWLRMPFGLKNAPATFQRVMQKVLKGLRFKFVINYLDDLIIYSPDFESHLDHIRQVFERLSEHHIKLKKSKCLFAQTEIEFLGSIIGNDQVRPGTRKVLAVKEFPVPTNRVEVQRFYGLCNWFRKFIPNFTEIAYPLTCLTKKGSVFLMGDKELKAFNTLKEILMSEPVLAIFDPDKNCELFVDASRIGIGGILCQRDEDQELHPIAYFSSRLSPPQENWHTTDLESLALVESVEHFDDYLSGRPFIVYSDHSALTWLLDSTRLTGKAYRWFVRMSQYSMQIIHRKGRLMTHVDALSRAPIKDPVTHSIFTCYGTPEEKEAFSARLQPLTLDELKAAQTNSDLSFVITPVPNKDGIICINRNGACRAVVPDDLRRTVVEYYHSEYGHPSLSKTRRLVAHYYWWPTLTQDVDDHCRSCPVCQLSKSPNSPSFGQLQPLPSPAEPLELVSMDAMIMGSVAQATKAKNIQVIIDHNSRYCWAKATPKNTFETVKTVLTNIFNSGVWPKLLLTDRGTNFTTKKFRKFLGTHGCRHLLTTSYHPQCNGMVEKMNRTLKDRLIIAHHLNPKKKWSSLLEEVVDQYNRTPHDVTGFPPVYLMYGLRPSDSPLPPPPIEPLEQARKMAQDRTIRHQQMKKSRYDSHHPPTPFKPGDLVRRQIAANHPSQDKLSTRFHGPYTIVSQSGTNTFYLQHVDGQDTDPVHVNVSQLRHWFTPTRLNHSSPTSNRSATSTPSSSPPTPPVPSSKTTGRKSPIITRSRSAFKRGGEWEEFSLCNARVSLIAHRSLIGDHWSPRAVHYPLCTPYWPSLTIHHPPSTTRGPLLTAYHPQSTVHRPLRPTTVHNGPLRPAVVHRPYSSLLHHYILLIIPHDSLLAPDWRPSGPHKGLF